MSNPADIHGDVATILERLNVLTEARGVERCVLIVDMAQRLSALDEAIKALETELRDLRSVGAAEADTESVGGRTYTIGKTN